VTSSISVLEAARQYYFFSFFISDHKDP